VRGGVRKEAEAEEGQWWIRADLGVFDALRKRKRDDHDNDTDPSGGGGGGSSRFPMGALVA
jgi:hypothetical protein